MSMNLESLSQVGGVWERVVDFPQSPVNRLEAEEVRQGQRLRNTHVTTRIPTYYACIVYVRRYARHVNYPRVTIRQPNFTGQFLALLTGYAKTVLSHD